MLLGSLYYGWKALRKKRKEDLDLRVLKSSCYVERKAMEVDYISTRFQTLNSKKLPCVVILLRQSHVICDIGEKHMYCDPVFSCFISMHQGSFQGGTSSNFLMWFKDISYLV